MNELSSDAKRPLLLSCHGSPEYEAMINDHRERHQSYADRHGYEYKVVALDHDAPYDPWSRLKLIREEIRAEQWSHVFWLDADCIVIDPKVDMRLTLPDFASYAFTVHPYPIATYRANRWHWQTGQMYFRCDAHAMFLICNCIEYAKFYANDQHAINTRLMENLPLQQHLCTLYQSWNNTLHDEVNDGTIVAAFHGFGRDLNERRQAMLNVAAQFPYTMDGYADMGRRQLGDQYVADQLENARLQALAKSMNSPFSVKFSNALEAAFFPTGGDSQLGVSE